MTRKIGIKNSFAVAFTLLIGVTVIAVCGFLFFLFFTLEHFPLPLMITICALCGIMAIAAFFVMVIKIRSLLE